MPSGPPQTERKIEPRGLSQADAASYIGISTSLFAKMVEDGRMPTAKRINKRLVWDRHQLDDAFEALPEDSDNPWDALVTGEQK